MMADSAAMDKFSAIIDYLEGFNYRERRKVIWRRVEPRPARFFYKFRSLDSLSPDSVDRLRNIIVRSKLWFPSPLDLNDPFDMSAYVTFDGTPGEKRARLDQLFKERGMRWSERSRQIDRIMARPEPTIAALFNSSYLNHLGATGVCSFGGDPRSIQMWSHYASCHEGLCLQFETVRDPRLFYNCIKVKYSDEYPIIKWTTMGRDSLQAAIETKSERWKYEREWRIIFHNRGRQNLSFAPEALRGIIIGCRTKEATIDKLRELLNERSSLGLDMPVLYRTFKHQTKYKLIIRKER